MDIDLKIAQLRKQKGVSQQELAEYLRVTYQSVSKWETKVSLPDITLLPEIAKYFGVSVDEVLGLVPLKEAEYIARDTDDRTLWDRRKNVIDNDREFFWNDDYLAYLVKQVWKIDQPIDVVEFCCCNADLGKRLMRILPDGSTYTGVDSQVLITDAEQNLQGVSFPYELIASDIYEYRTERKFGLSITQATLRHMNHPKKILQSMKDVKAENGLVVCVEVNREIENDGVYVDGMDYSYLCTAFDWRKLWRKELENEGRDYAIGVRVPFYMREIGLQQVDVRMNDKVTFLTPDEPNYEKRMEELKRFRGWIYGQDNSIRGTNADFFLGRGYTREEIDQLAQFQKEMSDYLEKHSGEVSLLHYFGFLISYGRNRK